MAHSLGVVEGERQMISIWWFVLAAVVLTLLPELLRGFADYRMILYSLLIIALMMARPQGLFTFGRRTVKT